MPRADIIHLLYEQLRRHREREEKEEKAREDPWLALYRAYCKRPGRAPREVEDAVRLLGWDIDPGCVPAVAKSLALAMLAAMATLIPLYFLYLVLFQGIPLADLPGYLLFELSAGNLFLIALLLMPFLAAAATYGALLYYPLAARDSLIKETVPLLPENIGYLVLSMKLTPNLEKALEFAGSNGEGRLAEDFKKLLWEVRMGLHTSTEEAVDRMAYRWGRVLPEVKHALMRIRGAVLEPDEARRSFRLDEALKEIIEAVRRRMEDMASQMYMPSVQIFYLGVFLPLLLFIIIPVAAAFTDMPVASLSVLVILYIVLLPLTTYAFARSVLEKRPSFYKPPVPPPDVVDPSTRRRAVMVAGAVFLVFLLAGFFLHQYLDITYERAEEMYCGYVGCLREEYGFTTWEEGFTIPEVRSVLESFDMTPYWLIYGGILAVVGALAAYLYLREKPRLELQKKYMEMEEEFKDTVYLLASRMGEGKPLEGALDALLEFMPDATIVQHVFSRITYNIKALGLSLRDAIFDPIFGALRDVPSAFLRKAMNILTKAVELGTELASKALLSYSEQLRKEEEIVQAVRSKMGEIYTMMMSMAVLVGPIVLGITVALQQVITSSLMNVQAPEVPEELALQMGLNLPRMEMATKEMASPAEFLVVVFLYNLILTGLLTYYAVSLYEGKNTPKLLLTLGRNLLVSAILFVISSWLSVTLVRGMIG